MNLKVKFFASLKELTQLESMDIDLPNTIHTIHDLRVYLTTLSPSLSEALASNKNIKAAQNLEMVSLDTALLENAEVAFFPPVTGG